MKCVSQALGRLKLALVGVMLGMIMASTTVNAAAVAFGGVVVAGCTLSGLTYTCASSPTTNVDIVSLGVNYIVSIDGGSGDIYADTATLGVGAVIHGNLIATTTITLGVDSYVTGNATAGTTAILGAGAYVIRNMKAGTTATLGAFSYVGRNMNAASATLGANAYVCLNITAGTALFGADAYVHGDLKVTTATLGANAYVNRDLIATTVTMGAGGYVGGALVATTATLGAGVCYGSDETTGLKTRTIGSGAGVGVCPPIRPRTSCSPIIYVRENY